MNSQERVGWARSVMAGKQVNLDAMIARIDLDAKSAGDQLGGGDHSIPVSELVRGKLHYGLLRKPDFQRETNDWDIDNVVTLIRSFRDGRLIPSIILWRSNAGYSFVIDGAHRLSAFIAWVNDDYGDREISQKFFNHQIPKRQKDIAEECRAQVARVGTYSDLSKALNDETPSAERLKWAANIAKSLATQYVAGDADAAQESFLAINQRAVAIDATEKYMILSRRKPDVIAARALVRNATGHQYWSRFADDKKETIEKLTNDIYGMIFQPENEDIARSIELPLAGQAYSGDSLRMALELVQFANEYRASKSEEEEADDLDGDSTIKFLERVKSVFRRISGPQSASLALHPGVYFWGSTGRHHPTAVLAVIGFVKYLIKHDKLNEFSTYRAQFEEFLVTEEAIIKHILGKYGGWAKSAPTVFRLYETIFQGFSAGLDRAAIREGIINEPRFAGTKEALELHESPGKRPTPGSKAAVRRRTLLDSAVRCPICHARLSSTSFSDDHIQRVQDGGRGTAENLQLTHPYCNSGFKEHLNHKGLPGPANPFA